LTKGLSNHPHVPYLNEKWMFIVKWTLVVGNCHSEVTCKRLTKLWWCMGSHFFHHIEISNLKIWKNFKPISKNLWFSIHIHHFLFKNHQNYFGFHILSKSRFLQITFKT
jgi:hypothetical protein